MLRKSSLSDVESHALFSLARSWSILSPDDKLASVELNYVIVTTILGEGVKSQGELSSSPNSTTHKVSLGKLSNLF